MSSLVLRNSVCGALLGLFAFVGAGCTVPETETDPTTDRATGTGGAGSQIVDASAQGDPSLLRKRNATIKTGYDTYIVRDVRFNTGEGFGGERAIMGHYNGTVWQFELRFIDSIEVLGQISASEARNAPDNYFVYDDLDLRKTFRTRLRKTDGEVIDFVVRINSIKGLLERGGPLQLSLEEMDTLRSIEFF